MIPQRSTIPMPAGTKSAQSVAKPAAPILAPPEADDPIGGDAPPTAPVLGESKAVLDPNAKFDGPPRPKSSARPGAAIQFSANAIEKVIALLQTALHPRVDYTEDMNSMRIAAEKTRVECINSALAMMKNPT